MWLRVKNDLINLNKVSCLAIVTPADDGMPHFRVRYAFSSSIDEKIDVEFKNRDEAEVHIAQVAEYIGLLQGHKVAFFA